MEKYLHKELFGHSFCLLGVIFDQITTIIGLSSFSRIYESNQIVAMLMGNNLGLWLLLDVMILSILFICVHFLFNFCYMRIKYRGFILIIPSLIFGFIRIYSGVHNMGITLSLIQNQYTAEHLFKKVLLDAWTVVNRFCSIVLAFIILLSSMSPLSHWLNFVEIRSRKCIRKIKL